MTDDLSTLTDQLADAVRGGRRVYLFTDFDGTLAPIIDQPLEVRLPPPVGRALAAIAADGRFEVAVVSGRDLADLTPRIDLPTAGFAGNHGLEIRGPGLRFVEPTAEASRPALAAVIAKLADELGAVPGLFVQDKGLTVSVHTRAVHPDYLPLVRGTTERVVGEVGAGIDLKPGLATIDLRPRVDWHKGSAVGWLRERVAPDAVPVFLGDDHSDEDAFAAIPDGFAVLVGDDRPTAAGYRLGSVERVGQLLSAMAGWCRGATPSR